MTLLSVVTLETRKKVVRQVWTPPDGYTCTRPYKVRVAPQTSKLLRLLYNTMQYNNGKSIVQYFIEGLDEQLNKSHPVHDWLTEKV